MKIGLVRHFKVARGYPNTFVSGEGLLKWIEEYDASDVIENEVDLLGVHWKGCYTSDLSRADYTAQKFYQGEIVRLPELREITMSPFFHNRWKLPFFVHLLFIRMAWYFNHKSQEEKRKSVLDRINIVLDEVLKGDEKEVLIVSHGGIMMFMRRELLRRGFKGPKFKTPENGKIYLFEKLS